MHPKCIGIIFCMLLLAPILATSVSADPKVDIKISGGHGLRVNVTNVGEEPLFDIIAVDMNPILIRRGFGMSPGMVEPLQPGESLTWKWRIPWVPMFSMLKIIPAVTLCKFTVKVYENGGDNTVWGEKTVTALYVCGFVKILSK